MALRPDPAEFCGDRRAPIALNPSEPARRREFVYLDNTGLLFPSADVVHAGLQEFEVPQGCREILGFVLDCEEGVTSPTPKKAPNCISRFVISVAEAPMYWVCLGSSAGALHLFWLWWRDRSFVSSVHHTVTSQLKMIATECCGIRCSMSCASAEVCSAMQGASGV